MNICEHEKDNWCGIFSAKALAEHYVCPATKLVVKPVVPTPVAEYLAKQH